MSGVRSLAAVLAVVASVFLAGCLGAPPRADAQVPEVALLGSRDVPPTILTWRGHLRIGAGADIPAHLDQTEPVLHQFMNKSFHLEIVEVPQTLRVNVAWTAAAAQLMLMVSEPYEEGQGARDPPQVRTLPAHPFVPGEDYYTDRGPLCMDIPTEELRVGRWAIMVHSAFAVEAALEFTTTAVGGAVRIVDEPASLSDPASLADAAAHKENPGDAIPCT